VSVAKETGQAAATVVAQNVIKMWARMWARSRANAAWFVNQDVEPQLMQMSVAVGTGGQLIYMPPGGLSGQPYGTLFGRPVIPTEFNPTLGTVGDIVLADWSQYKLANKGAVKAASSMHVQFLTDQMCWRFTARYDGQVTWKAALTPYKGTNTQSPFITLATRA
jgi:HK97 family phage major capsid protein